MPFSTKQSDVYYNDETKELFVCTVSSVSADRCPGSSDEAVQGALPIIYKIDKETNYKKCVYPRNLETIRTDEKSDLYKLTAPCSEGTDFDSITKPLINYNKRNSRYSVTFLGRYTDDGDGLSVNNYIFEDINSDFYLLDAKTYIPKDKFTNNLFTFENGHINSDLYIVGNTIRNGRPSWFNPSDGVEIERSPDYQIAPMYVQATSSLGFNLILDNKDVTIDALSGDAAFPMLYSGGFITYNPKYVAFDPQYTIRVDFRARSFTVPSPTAYGGTQSVGNSATRWIQQWAPAGAGEGFCLSFFKNPETDHYVIPNGIGSTLGYAEANFSSNEVAGTAQSTIGLFKRKDWSPNTGYENVGNIGNGSPADSLIGVGFDIGGNFASTSEEKNGWFDGTSYTATPCSVGIRGSAYHGTQVLTSVAMSAVGNTVPMHTSAVSAEFVDYRIDLTNKGTKVTVYNKLTSATDYNPILEFRLNVNTNTNANGESYDTWKGMRSILERRDNLLPPLNVGLSYTTSDKSANFELHKFEVTGVKITKPWNKKKIDEIEEPKKTKIDYLQESSKNLRKKLVNVESDDPVDVEMVVPAKQVISSTLNEDQYKPHITLCEGSEPEYVEQDVDIKITGIKPEQVDKTIEVARTGHIPKIPESPTIIKNFKPALELENIDVSGGDFHIKVEDDIWDTYLKCRYSDKKIRYKVADDTSGSFSILERGGQAASEVITAAGQGNKMQFQDEEPDPITMGGRGGQAAASNQQLNIAKQGNLKALYHEGRLAWGRLYVNSKYSIFVRTVVLDNFINGDDYNDWYGRTVKMKHARSGRSSEQQDHADGIMGSIAKAFLEADIVGQQIKIWNKEGVKKKDRTYNWVLNFDPAHPSPPDKMNELLTRTHPDTDYPIIGIDARNWVDNFKKIGFTHIPSANLRNNTLTPIPNIPGIGEDFVCKAKWDIPEDGPDEDHKGVDDYYSLTEGAKNMAETMVSNYNKAVADEEAGIPPKEETAGGQATTSDMKTGGELAAGRDSSWIKATGLTKYSEHGNYQHGTQTGGTTSSGTGVAGNVSDIGDSEGRPPGWNENLSPNTTGKTESGTAGEITTLDSKSLNLTNPAPKPDAGSTTGGKKAGGSNTTKGGNLKSKPTDKGTKNTWSLEGGEPE